MFENIACYSTIKERGIVPGIHIIKCVRGFNSAIDAHDFALDQREKIVGKDMYLNHSLVLESTDCHCGTLWFEPNWWVKYELRNKYKLRDCQLEISYKDTL